ncbi:immunoglobulin-like domain-containing protein [Bacillus dakarensis]|uniref:immunoglobulin-like domain-containing protein n=1 Tax=Robertmurraya dakarensis TaxID=1926278 RepID=UPI0009819227|nr:immunoglobulin-like domain-containing protein [Bacillus dakarensis]
MKKTTIILSFFILCLLTAFEFASAGSFPGSVSGSTAESPLSGSGKGIVTVTNAPTNAVLKLYKADNLQAVVQKIEAAQSSVEFTEVDPGEYVVTSTTLVDGNEVVSDYSTNVSVKPAPVIISSVDGSDEISVSGGYPGAKFTLKNSTIAGYIPKTIDADADGKGIFKNIDPGEGYQVTQTFNELESALSTSKPITIRPNQVTVLVQKEPGPTNNEGEITVTDIKVGSTLSLYHSSGKLAKTPVIVNSPSGYTFGGLSAGTYYVVQTINDIPSVDSELVTLVDQEIPVIKLKGDNPITIIYDRNQLNYNEPGADVIDNIDSARTIDNGVNPIPADAKPGIYTLKYNAEDSNGNKAAEVTRTVIIQPNKLTLGATDTELTIPTDSTGEIKINGVIPATGVLLYLYQDIGNDNDNSNDILVRGPIQNATDGMTINDIPVGKNYYVIQEYGTVKSLPSDRVHILDKTPPQIKKIGSDIKLIVGARYVEQGALATDNIDTELDVVTTGFVDTSIPGIYTITYSVNDQGNNGPVTATRTVTVLPPAVIAIGSTADMGEVGVKNALVGSVLMLYKSDDTFVKQSPKLTDGETTYIFKNIEPGSYYIIQSFESVDGTGLVSAKSNIVEVVDIDRPQISLNGPEKITVIWNEDKEEFYRGSTNTFIDPGATSEDYIDGDLTRALTKVMIPPFNSQTCSDPNKPVNCEVQIPEPGKYTITYSVTAQRGTEAINKLRKLTVAPPKVDKTIALKSTSGTSSIEIISGLYHHSTTVVNLYNTFNQLIESKPVPNNTKAVFSEVPAGIGYYVTQTVNGVESIPSDPVNISQYSDAELDKFIGFASFSFNGLNSEGIIDQTNGEILITVPKGTDVTNLKAVFTLFQGNERVQVNGVTQTSGSSSQNYKNPVSFTVIAAADMTVKKVYTVTVKEANSAITTWADAVKKNMVLNSYQPSAITLTAPEKALASEKGISFIADHFAIHVSPANLLESMNPTLTVNEVSRRSIITANDPSWRNELSNIIELDWDNQSGPFIQPIEVEIPNEENKVFVRLKRQTNGQLFAIVQPSKQSGNTIIGMATEPGQYALLTKTYGPILLRPKEDTYRLFSIYPGAKIYYALNDKKIAFERSGDDQTFADFLFSGRPSDLATWIPYKEEITGIKNKQVYALLEVDQIISPITVVSTPAVAQWTEEIPTVSPHKVWEIKFNSKVDRKALYADVIYVTDDTTGKRIDISLELSGDGTSLSVAPNRSYEANKQYTLWIDQEIKSEASDRFLNEPIKLTFVAK